MRRGSSTLAIVLAVALSPAAPATAAGEVVVSMPGGVLFDSCGDYGFTYSAPVSPGGYWSMDLSLIGPDGNEAAAAYLYGDSPAGADAFFLCESPNLAGTYTITGTGETCDADYNCTAISAATTQVTFRHPRTRTSLRAKPRHPGRGQVVRFVVKVKDERPHGYYRTPYATVRLQSRRAGRGWRTITKALTNSHGRVTMRARYRGGRVAVRAVTKRDSDRRGSRSRTIRFR